jgi:phospholipid/cholesterol/gamma-HCH transport system ATP-binding protein
MTDASQQRVHLAFRGLVVRFDRPVLDHLDLDVQRGETLTVLGPSGAGKSVLLRTAIGLIKPSEGQVLLWGRDLVPLSERELRQVRRRIGIVFQGGALFDSLTVAENIAYPVREHERWSEGRLWARVVEVLGWVGLDPQVASQLPAELSGGMRKRVALARAIVLEPELLLYDEPTTGLDPANVERVDALIQSIQSRLGVTSLIITHDVASAFRVSDRLAVLSGGRIAWIGSASQAQADPPQAMRDFLQASVGTGATV